MRKRFVLTTVVMIKMQAKLCIPAHADATEDIVSLAQMNIDKVYQIAEKIICICQEATNFEQYALVGSTLRSYLSWVKEQGKLQVVIEDNMLFWKA